MLLWHFTAKLWGYVRLHRFTRFRLLVQLFCIPTASQHFYFHFLLVKQHRPTSSPPCGGHTHLTQHSSPHVHGEGNKAGSALPGGPGRASASQRSQLEVRISSLNLHLWLYIYQFHLRHGFQGNWGKDLLQEGLFLPRAVEGCSDVRQDDAGSYPTLWLAGNVLSQAFCRQPEWENSPSALK